MEIIILNNNNPELGQKMFAQLSQSNTLSEFVRRSLSLDLDELIVWSNQKSYFFITNGIIDSGFNEKLKELAEKYDDMLYDDETTIKLNVEEHSLFIFIGDQSLALNEQFEIPKQVENFYVNF